MPCVAGPWIGSCSAACSVARRHDVMSAPQPLIAAAIALQYGRVTVAHYTFEYQRRSAR